jgi:uncharacterized protein (TIGR00266 family)
LRIYLNKGESIYTQPGAFVYSTGELEISTETLGIIGGIMRKILGGESLFINKIVAKENCIVGLAPKLPGKIVGITINNEEFVSFDYSYLAHYGNINIGVKSVGIKGIFMDNIYWLHYRGKGIVWLNTFGDIEYIELKEGEKLIVDNNNLLAINANANYRIIKFGGLKSFLFSGEGFVVEINGPAKVYIQTRNLDNYLEYLRRMLRL